MSFSDPAAGFHRVPAPGHGPEVGAAIGLVAGLGMLLIWRSGSRAPARSRRRMHWLRQRDELIRQAGVEGVNSAQLFLIQLLSALLALVLVLAITSTITIALCFAAFGFVSPLGVVRRMRQRRRLALRELWPEAIDNLAPAVRAGMSLPEGIVGLSERGPAPLRPAFGRFAVLYRASGRFSACLDSLKADLADPAGDRVCEILRVAREVGGTDLGTVLRTLSDLLRDDARTRAELETRQGWTVNATRQ